MQLKNKKPSIRLALAAASCALLAEQSVVNAAEVENWQIDFGTLFYKEKNRVSILEPILIGTRKFNQEDFVSFKLVNDTISGASPLGASISNEKQMIPAQTSTTASGSTSAQADTVVEPYAMPLKDFSDKRNSISVDWQKAYSRTFRTILGANYSSENDYTSAGTSINFQKDTADKLTTFTLGLSFSLDAIEPSGSIPEPLAVLVTRDAAGMQGDDDDREDEDDDDEHEDDDFAGERKYLTDFLFGITQIVSRRVITQLNYSIGRSSGYLTDPYKIVSRVDPVTGSSVDYLSEKRPDSRLRQTIFWKTVFHLPSDVVHISYRYYWDDWSIQAHTVDVKYRLNFGDHLYFMPNVRYYKQTGAKFFNYSLLNSVALPNYASADLRLAPMQSTTSGLKLGYDFSSNTTVSLRVEYMQQWGEKNPAQAVGLQRELDLFPKLEVMMYTFSFSTIF